MASTESAGAGSRLPTVQLWTPPRLDDAACQRVGDVIATLRGRLRATRGAGPTQQALPKIGVLLRLPGAADAQLVDRARWLAAMVGEAGADDALAWGLCLDGVVDGPRLEAFGELFDQCGWLHLAGTASSCSEVRFACQVATWRVGPPPLSRAVHDEAGVRAALADGADAMTLSPILSTPSKPDVTPLGWATLARCAALAPGRVWALGGLRPHDLGRAQAMGSAGLALLGAAWSAEAMAWSNLPPDTAASP